MQDQLHHIITRMQPDIVAFCTHLLQTPSVNGVNDEFELASSIATQARKLGLHVQLVGENPRRPNVIVSTHETGETGLLLIGHLDTVPPGDDSQWTFPPFSGHVSGDKIYGRGAVDTKGGMAAALYALAALKQLPEALLAGRVQLICVPDEESGATGTLGIKYLHEENLLRCLGAIYAYSGDQITLGHRGLLRYRIVCEGEAIHTGALEWQEEQAGANAVLGLSHLLLELYASGADLPYSETPYFEQYKTVITPGTVIHGGVSVNIVPDRCEALVDIRLTPEYDLERIDTILYKLIRQIIRDWDEKIAFDVQLLNYAPAAISDENAPIFGILEKATRQVKGITPERVVAGPANEGYLLIERGIPTVCGFGPSGANAHAVDEYVEIKSLTDAALIFALTASDLSRQLL